MVEAIAADLSAIDAAHVTLTSDTRYPIQAARCEVIVVRSRLETSAAFDLLGSMSDCTLLIAPESDGTLVQLCRRVETLDGQLLGPGVPLVELCTDKHATAAHLAAAAVPVPHGLRLDVGDCLAADFDYPAVAKPRDGCGSQGVLRFEDAGEAGKFGRLLWPARLERYCPGLSASVAVLAGPKELRALPPCRQHLSEDGRFQYQGGSLPLEPDLARRAEALALQAVESLPDPRGFIGVDLVLGSSASEDRVIEINPRLTTSYVGLREACRGNLAEAMLKIAQGEPAELSFRDDPLQFDADGTVRFLQGKL